MEEFRVEYTGQENNYSYSGTWADEIVEAETAEEAIELLKQHFIENDATPEDYIYRAHIGPEDYNSEFVYGAK